MEKHNRLINTILSRKPNLKTASDTEPSPESIHRVYQLIEKGDITKESWMKVIDTTDSPLPRTARSDSPETISLHNTIASDTYLRHILAYASGVGFDNYQQTTPKNLLTFLETFTNPGVFEPAEDAFIQAIRQNQDEVETVRYEKAIRKFKQLVYGEKQEYWSTVNHIITEYRDFRTSNLVKTFLKNAWIDGDPWPQGDKEYHLTPETLHTVGLGPRHKIEIGGIEIALSDSFIAEGRDAIIGYVKIGDKVHVRSYYRSNSQGIWRYLPDYVAEDGKITVFGRGYHQETLILPSLLQKELSRINNAYTIEDYPGTNMNYFLAGTAKRYETKEEYEEKRENHELSGDVYREVSDEPMINLGEIGERKHPPEGMDIDGAEGPDFRHELNSYQIDSNLYGKVFVREFASYDGTLSYLFCELNSSNEKKAWVGNIEAKSPITSTGLKSEWISTGDIATPLYEYYRYDGGFGDLTDKKGNYIGMWSRYVSRMPIIKRYFYSGREESAKN